MFHVIMGVIMGLLVVEVRRVFLVRGVDGGVLGVALGLICVVVGDGAVDVDSVHAEAGAEELWADETLDVGVGAGWWGWRRA